MSKISIVVDITTNPGDFDKFYELMLIHGAASRQEPGCERFDLAVPLKSENRLLIYEIYTHRAAFDTHASSERMKEHGANTKPLVKDRMLAVCELKDSGDF